MTTTVTKSIGTATGSAGTGTVTAAASTAVVGVGTLFLTEMVDGNGFPVTMLVSGTLYNVASITDNTHLTLLTSTTFTAASFTIGLRDYSTVQAWEDALPANLVTGDTIQIGSMYNDSEFTATANILTIAGKTTNSTHTITLTAAPGQSFEDTQTNPCVYDSTKGVGIRLSSGSYKTLVLTALANVFFSRIQFKTNVASGNIVLDTAFTTANNCIFDGGGSSTGVAVLKIALNCLFLDRNAITGHPTLNISSSGAIVSCCTFVLLGAGAGQAITSLYSSPSVKNCAFFGAYGNNFKVSHGTLTYQNCVTDNAVWGTTGTGGVLTDGGSNLVSKTFANQFVSITADFRLKAGSDCLDAGISDTANIPAANDIYGTSRPQGSAWDVGCHELIVASGQVFMGWLPRYRS